MSKQFIDKLAFIEILDKKVLVTLSKGKQVWYIPGGKREERETDKQALMREVKEELGVELVPASIEKYVVFEAQADGKPEGEVVRMSCYRAVYVGVIKPSSEIEKVDYFPYGRKDECSEVDGLIFDDLFERGLIC